MPACNKCGNRLELVEFMIPGPNGPTDKKQELVLWCPKCIQGITVVPKTDLDTAKSLLRETLSFIAFCCGDPAGPELTERITNLLESR
jgi:hypothetical protein